MAQVIPDQHFWQEEQNRRLQLENELARKELSIPLASRQEQHGHLASSQMKEDEWSNLVKPVIAILRKHGNIFPMEDQNVVTEQCTRMKDLILAAHHETIKYRTKGRVWRALRNRAEEYIRQFRRASQYYFANQTDQQMDPAMFQTTVADFHAALSTTLTGLRAAMGQQLVEQEVPDADYDSDGGEPIRNLQTNYGAPQPFSDLVQGIIQMADTLRARGVAGAASGPSQVNEETIKEQAQKMKEYKENIEKAEKEKNDLIIARGRPSGDKQCAKEKAEIERLEVELKNLQDKYDEAKNQLDQASEYIDGVSRGRTVREPPDDVGGVHLSDALFDELIKHFSGYHANAELSNARVDALTSNLKHTLAEKGSEAFQQQFSQEIAAADAARAQKDEIIAQMQRSLDEANGELTGLKESDRTLREQVRDMTLSRDDAIARYDAANELVDRLQSAAAVVPDDAYNRLEAEKDKIMQYVDDMGTDIEKREALMSDLQRQLVEREEQVRELTYTLAWDTDASRNRQEVQDLRERIVAYEHVIENYLKASAVRTLDAADAPDRDDPSEREELTRVRKELERELNLVRQEPEHSQPRGVDDTAEVDYTAEVANLRAQVTTLQAEVNTLQAELEQTLAARPENVVPDSVLAQAHADLAERDQRIAALERQITENTQRYGKQITDIQARLDEAKTNANGISPEDLRLLRKNLADCRRQHQRDQAANNELQGELDACRRRGALKDQRILKFLEERAAGQVTANEEQAEELRELRENIENERDALDRELDQLREERGQKAEEDREKAEAEHTADMERAAADESIRDESVAAFDSNEEINKEHIARINAQRRQITELRARINSLGMEMATVRAEATTLRAERERVNNTIRELRAQIQAQAEGEGGFAPPGPLENLEDLENQIAVLEARLEACEQTGAALQLQRDQAIAERENIEQRVGDLQTAHDASKFVEFLSLLSLHVINMLSFSGWRRPQARHETY